MAKLVECIPNFSVSREKDPAVFQGLVEVAESIPGCTPFDVQSDGNHNRCVFTLIGSPAAIEEAAFQLCKRPPRPSTCACTRGSIPGWAPPM